MMADAKLWQALIVAAVTGLITAITTIWAKPIIDGWRTRREEREVWATYIDELRRDFLESGRIVERMKADQDAGVSGFPVPPNLLKLVVPSDLFPQKILLVKALPRDDRKAAGELQKLLINHEIDVDYLVSVASPGNEVVYRRAVEELGGKIHFLSVRLNKLYPKGVKQPRTEWPGNPRPKNLVYTSGQTSPSLTEAEREQLAATQA